MRKSMYIIYILVILVSFKTVKGENVFPRAWGKEGETWDRKVLLDWSWSGYAAKERQYADPPFAANILDFGAVGDGIHDCTGPFTAAVEHVSASGGGTILVPEGKYLLKRRLVISGSNIVVKGDGPGVTILYYEDPLSKLDGIVINGKRLQSPYSWQDGMVQIKGSDPGSHSPRGHHDNGWVVEPAKMGTRRLHLNSIEGLAAGQWARLLLSDKGGRLVSKLYGTDMKKIEKLKGQSEDCEPVCASDVTGERDLIRWASKILSIEADNWVVLQRPLPVDVELDWNARLMPFPESMVKETGIRDLSIEFAWDTARPHHEEVGYNAIFIENAVNAFVYNVDVMNVEQGVLVKYSQMVSIDKISVKVSKPRKTGSLPWDGHIGIAMYDSSDVEINNFNIRGEWIHDISVRGTLFAVIHNGRGENLRLDTHRSAPYGTLFSDIYLGKGTRPFGTGGYISRGLPVAKYTTYYNLRSKSYKPIKMPSTTIAGSCTWGKQVNYIGSWSGPTCPGYYVETYKQGSIFPKDLYGSMIDRKYRVRGEYEAGLISGEGAILPRTTRGDSGSMTADEIPPAGDGSYPIIGSQDFY